jgi:pyruvate formate lyase activating enzyme
MYGARKICGRFMEAESVFTEIEKDHAFYDVSGGGVTFSGGECLLQPEFLRVLLRRCTEAGIRTALDTAGNVPESLIAKLLPLTDLFLYDIKCITEETHRIFTGTSNTTIVSNLRFLLNRSPEKVWLRIPIIPGFNANIDEINAMRDFLAPLPPPARIELLPYHRLGENKWEALGMKNNFMPAVPDEETMKAFRDIFRGI